MNLDVTAYYKGYHGDLNETFAVGKVDDESRKLVRTAYECMMMAIEQTKPGMPFAEIGMIIGRYAKRNGFSVDKTYCGHGINTLFHTAPTIPHYAHNNTSGSMKAGNIFTIEPMINAGGHEDRCWPDEWTVVTRDGKRSAQFEHTILISEAGHEILTARNESSNPLWFL